MTAELNWTSTRIAEVGGNEYDVSEMELGGERFVASKLAIAPSTRELFSLQKSRVMVEELVELTSSLPAHNIVEIGVFQGGSAALLALLPTTEKLLAIEYNDLGGTALEQFVTDTGRQERVFLASETDQADRESVLAAVASAGMAVLDLVIDDASHRYDETVSSFNTLFPLIRPGGVYMLEDWQWAHVRGIGLGEEFAPRGATSLTTMVFEMVMACATNTDVIDDVRIGPDAVLVRRGPAALDPDGFALRDLYDEISADLLGDWST